jgi:ankyrin repeat protein
MIAAGNGNREAVELLLKLGADEDLKDRAGKAAADYAWEHGRKDLEPLLR